MVRIDGIGFSAIGRLQLLRLLQERARAARVDVAFERPVGSLAEVTDADLVVGADGANSLVRRSRERELGASVRFLTNRFAWYGTTRRFDTLTQSFRRSAHGTFNAHHYRHAPDMSTFVVETDRATWERAGFEAMDAGATTAYLETVFADILRAISRDAPLTTALAAFGVVLVLVVSLRRARHVFQISSALFAGVALMAGLAALFKVKYNFFNFVALPTTFGIGVDYAVNLHERYRLDGPGSMPTAQ